jgi:hypothetical protein
MSILEPLFDRSKTGVTMTNPSRVHSLALRELTGSALRWITAFAPFDTYSAARYQR